MADTVAKKAESSDIRRLCRGELVQRRSPKMCCEHTGLPALCVSFCKFHLLFLTYCIIYWGKHRQGWGSSPPQLQRLLVYFTWWLCYIKYINNAWHLNSDRVIPHLCYFFPSSRLSLMSSQRQALSLQQTGKQIAPADFWIFCAEHDIPLRHIILSYVIC